MATKIVNRRPGKIARAARVKVKEPLVRKLGAGSASAIVGVGASAGGLEAFTELLSHLPDDTGLAFVLIQHLDPKHESHLAELLSKASKMPVSEVKGETRPQANRVYVIPPQRNLGISDGVINTSARPARGSNMPVDSFFRALAADRGSKAIGVVLSGTASDGTLGLQAIKAAGGITFAQERRTAKFDGMPASAIAAGVVDFVLPPAGIAKKLVAIARDSHVSIEPRTAAGEPGEAELTKIFRLLRTATGVDFTYYKHSTLQRRIKRRMALRGFANLKDYCRDLERNRDEANALCESFFITVTQFFREPAVFEELKKKVFPALVENRSPEDPIRVWVPGCSTGEEAYSIAICLTEFMEETKVDFPFEIFATDISETAIEKARAGTYTDAALAHVSPRRLARFFTGTEHGHQIAKAIREVCVFARHDVSQDPPFSRLDLISCCNVLIYLGTVLQRKVLSILHYALKPTGFLILGASETIGTLSESFHQLEKARKIYSVRPAATAPVPRPREGRRPEGREKIPVSQPGLDVQNEAPPSAVIDNALNTVREYLQSIVEQNATTLEELRAANEEAQAGNEELETAQEELESANEELNTLNEDLKVSNTEFSQVNRDLANLLESISIPLVMVGRDLRIRRFTRAMEPMLNLIASDVGRSITDIQPRMELPGLRNLLLEAMEGGNRKPRDIRDSYGHWYSLRILPSAGPDGKTDGAVLMLIDIDAAKRGLDFAEAIVETVREPLVILNQNLEVMQANKAFYATFQAAREETEGRLIYDLGNGQWDIPKLRELLENILPAHATFRDFEVTHEFETVGRKVMRLNASEIFNPNAQARTILLAIEDVTDRKHAEEALRTTNAELQNFAYALTHDLQEPLRMVVNFTELLGREYAGKLGEEADKYISYSVEGALRIEALLKALLAYWEIAERTQDSFASIDCGAVLAKTLLNLHTAIAESGATVTSDPLPTVVAEEIILMQLFQNLISNAIKYKGAETPKIHVSAERDGKGWLFAVRDNGIGIDSQDAGRVFGMFKRLHGKEIPGTGIGLALCKKVVERQGGRIWVESEPGRGSTFKFTIPHTVSGAGPRP